MLASLLVHPFLMPIGLLLAGMAAIAKAPIQPVRAGAPALPPADSSIITPPPTYPPVADLLDFEMLADKKVVQRFKTPVVSALMGALSQSRLATDAEGNAMSPKPGVLVYKLVEAMQGMPVAAEAAMDAKRAGFLVLASTSMVDVAKGGEAEHYLVFCDVAEKALATNAGELAILLEPVPEHMVSSMKVGGIEMIPTPTTPVPATPTEPAVSTEPVAKVDAEAPTEPAPTPPIAVKVAALKKAKGKTTSKTKAPTMTDDIDAIDLVPSARQKRAAERAKKASTNRRMNGAAAAPAFATPSLEIPKDDATA